MLHGFKRAIERSLPGLASTVRDFRENRMRHRARLRRTPQGFLLCGHAQMESGTFEQTETAFIVGALQQADVFFDVGANVGYYACLARSLGKKVLAFEPLPQNLEYLYANLLANGWADVEVFPLGLSAAPGLATLYGGRAGASMIEAWAGTSVSWSRPIALSTLDTIVGDRFNGSRVLVKIDVEGAEFSVLQGAAAFLRRQPSPVWIVEICFSENQPVGINPHFRDVFEFFWTAGYEATGVTTGLVVGRAEVDEWLRAGKRQLEEVNFVFASPGNRLP